MSALIAVWVVTAAGLLRFFGDAGELHYPDMGQWLLDGVFVHDLVRSAPSDPYAFATEYHAQYPALGIGYRPPLFAAVLAVFNGLFGPSVSAARVALVLVALAGVTAWFTFVSTRLGLGVAVGSSLLLVTTPFLTQWGWYVMADWPALAMVMLAALVFHRFVESGSRRDLVLSVLLTTAAVWTKQHAVFIGLWFGAVAIQTGAARRWLRRRDVGVATIATLLLISPVFAAAVWLGDRPLSETIGTGRLADPLLRLGVDNLLAYPRAVTGQLTTPVLILSVVGAIGAVVKRDRRFVSFALLVLTVYLFFTYLVAKDMRYTIFWIPAFCVFAAAPLALTTARAARAVYSIGLAAIVIFQLIEVWALVPSRAPGTRDAAAYVLDHSVSPTVLVDCLYESSFIYFMRALDPERSMQVVKAFHLLDRAGTEATADEVSELVSALGVEYVAIGNAGDRPAYASLQEVVLAPPFRLVKEIPAEPTRRTPGRGRAIQIFRNEAYEPATATTVRLWLPRAGRWIEHDLDLPERNVGAAVIVGGGK